MHAFQVWAPSPGKIELQVEDERYQMTRLANGWWTAEVGAAKPGSNYGFVVDSDGPFPDPRSPWQPEGVHASSRTVDLGVFQWTDQEFRAPPLCSALIYELHVGTFTPEGTFDAAISK